MRIASFFSCLAAGLAVLSATPAQAVVFQIDVDTTVVNGVAGASPLITQAGWTSLDATNSNGSSVTVAGTTFTAFSADGSRLRSGTNGGTALTRDFIFDDGANQAVGLQVFNLPVGLWQVEVWSWDDTFPTGNQIVGITRFQAGPEIIYTNTFTPNPTTPFTFIVDTRTTVLPDGFGIFTRENNSQDRARFNALRMTNLVPEPTTAGLGMLGAAALLARRRRSSSH